MKRQVCEVSKTLNESTGGTKVYAATQLQSSFLAAMIMATLRVYRFGQDSWPAAYIASIASTVSVDVWHVDEPREHWAW